MSDVRRKGIEKQQENVELVLLDCFFIFLVFHVYESMNNQQTFYGERMFSNLFGIKQKSKAAKHLH